MMKQGSEWISTCPKLRRGEKEATYLSVAQAVDGIFEKFLHDVVKGASMNA